MKYIYLLDSNIVSEISKPLPNQNVLKKIQEYEKFCAISVITFQELVLGCNLLPEGKRKEEVKSYLNIVLRKFEIIPYEKDSATIYAETVAKCKTNGLPRPICDTQIAATAIANNLILVTRNTKDFSPLFPYCSLKLENWFEE